MARSQAPPGVNVGRGNPTLKGSNPNGEAALTAGSTLSGLELALATVGFAPHGCAQPTAIQICPLQGQQAFHADPCVQRPGLAGHAQLSKGGRYISRTRDENPPENLSKKGGRRNDKVVKPSGDYPDGFLKTTTLIIFIGADHAEGRRHLKMRCDALR